MVGALLMTASGCGLESARLPDGSRRFDEPWRIIWHSARAQASADFGCPVNRLQSRGWKRTHRPYFYGCGKSATYRCERHERRADQDIERELDHIWEVHYVCRQDAVSTP